jgi:hypothetical protein
MQSLHCNLCKHYLGGGECLAYPAGIPDEIRTGAKDHANPADGDNGIQFAPDPDLMGMTHGLARSIARLKKSEPSLLLSEDFEKLQKAVSSHEVQDIVGRKGAALTPAGIFLLREYARGVLAGHPDKDTEKKYKGTAMGPYMKRIKKNNQIAEYYAQ